MGDLRERIFEIAGEMGLAGLGVGDAAAFPETREDLERRKREGLAGKLAFTYRQSDAASDVRRTFPWARRLVTGAAAYLPVAGTPGPERPGSGRIARFATADHYVPLRRALQAVADELARAGHRAEVLVDDPRLVDRAAAVRAGVGWWGKNTMVLSPGYGPWLLLGSVATDAELVTGEPMVRDCGTCDACLPACPTAALVAPGVLDATRCIAYWLQTPGTIPRWMRERIGDRVYGCDDCLEACPPGHRLLETATAGNGRIDLGRLLTASDHELEAEIGHWYIPRRDFDYVRRNALIALGNTAGPEHLTLVLSYLNHRRAVLRRHAAWALGRMGEPGKQHLRGRLDGESDPEVRVEIQAALEA